MNLPLDNQDGQRVSDTLDRAADLIEPEGAWAQGALGRSSSGSPVPIDEAVCWCASGAIMRVLPAECSPSAAFAMLESVIGGNIIPHWNDSSGQSQQCVVSCLREAAALAREQGE